MGCLFALALWWCWEVIRRLRSDITEFRTTDVGGRVIIAAIWLATLVIIYLAVAYFAVPVVRGIHSSSERMSTVPANSGIPRQPRHPSRPVPGNLLPLPSENAPQYRDAPSPMQLKGRSKRFGEGAARASSMETTGTERPPIQQTNSRQSPASWGGSRNNALRASPCGSRWWRGEDSNLRSAERDRFTVCCH